MTQEMAQVKDLLKKIRVLKDQGLKGIRVTASFIGRRVQPIKSHVHPAWEYSGRADPTSESEMPIRKKEVI